MNETPLIECRRCHESKPVEDFPRDRSRPTGFYPYCKVCNAANMRAYYAKYSAEIREKQNAIPSRSKPWYERNRAQAVEIYGGKCTDCGTTEKLDLDHVNEDGNEHREIEHPALMY